MKTTSILVLTFLIYCHLLAAQTRETVTFHHEADIGPGANLGSAAVFVSGSLPALGSWDLSQSIQMQQIDEGVWEVDISLPVNQTYDYRFYDRSINTTQTSDPAHGTSLTDVLTASTSTVALDPGTKLLSYRGSLANPVLYWRQGDDVAFSTVALSTVGDWEESGAFGQANASFDFYVLGDGGGREPAGVETFFTTAIDHVFVQGGELFAYEPMASVSPAARDYDPLSPPVLASSILEEDRSYRVFLPRGYQEHGDRYYPVIYFQDGEDLFESQTIALDPDGSTIGGLVSAGQMHEAILVGIDQLANSERLTTNEPYYANGVAGIFQDHADFLRLELMPLINERYRTLGGAENTAVLGYEFGAAISLYYAWDFPSVFGKAGLLSMGDRKGLASLISNDLKRAVQIYLDSSTSGFAAVRDMRDDLLNKVNDRHVVEGDLRYRYVPGQTSTREAYRTRLAEMLPFLFPASEPMDASAAQSANPYWLSFYGLTSADWDLDLDGDGWSTRVEYAFGTDPTDGASFFDFDSAFSNDGLAVSFPSNLGVQYQFEESFSLGEWQDVGDAFMGSGQLIDGAIQFEDPMPERYFLRLNAAQPVDTDRDGLTDIEESALLLTARDLPDTDGDGFDDGDEVLYLGTDPLVPNVTGGIISGSVFNDADGDSDLAGEEPLAGVTVYLDLDYDRILDSNEPSQVTDAAGAYAFPGLAPGRYHVIQVVPPGNVQTVPGMLPGQPDGFPDTLVSLDYQPIEAAPTPYGQYALDDHGIPTAVFPSRAYEPVDPALVLKPIAERNLAFALGIYNTTEFVSLSEDTVMTVSFDDEEIIDGEGHDFQVVAVDQHNAGEKVEVWVGATLDQMTFLTIVGEGGRQGIDLARYGIDYPIRYVRLRSLNSGGGSPGYDLVGFQAIHFAPFASEVHLVDLAEGVSVSDVDFGRFGRDLPPRVFLSNDGAELRAGDLATVVVSGSDDFDVPTLALTVNGSPVALNGEGQGSVQAVFPGELRLEATATDSAGQTTTSSLKLFVLNADGSLPEIPNVPGLEELEAGSPQIRIHSPGSGTAADADAPVVVTVEHENLTSWQVHYAPMEDIDPYDLAAADPDYVLIGSGAGEVINQSLGTFPGTSLVDGLYFLRVSAVGNGLSSYQGHVVAVRTDPSEFYPAIVITSPEEGGMATYLTDIVGSIESSRPLREWYVEWADAAAMNVEDLSETSGVEFTRIAEGTETQSAGSTLATFDPTMLPNGTYLLKVTAWNDIGLGWTEGVLVNVCGENKPGRLRVTFDDALVDLAGLPIQIQRVYDSFASGVSGDFGFGWSMGIAEADIRDTAPDGGAAISTVAWKPGTRLYLNAPDGRRIGFTFGIEQASVGFLGTNFRATFQPDPGVYETLRVPEGDAGFLGQASDGSVVTSFIGLPYNPDIFILTTKDGTDYTYGETTGLLDVQDKGGNKLVFTEEGIRHSSGAAVTFARDTAGRITAITDPGGMVWAYGYDGDGNLVSVTDPSGEMTTMAYFNEPVHYLDSVTDSLGRVGVRYEYDANGRLAAVIDEAGNRSEQSWDLEGFSGTVSDLRGNVTTIRYDALGNILQEELPSGGVITRAYEDAMNPNLETSLTDARGHTTTYQYDARGNRTRLAAPLGGAATATYNEYGQPLTWSTPNFVNQEFVYGDRGELIEHRYSNAQVRRFEHTADGRISSWTDMAGNQSFMGYKGPFGKLSSLMNQTGAAVSASYQSNGLLASLEDNFGQTSFTYDNVGRVLTETDALGNVISYTYDGGELAQAIDETGVTRQFTYNSKGQVLTQTLAGELTAFAYDADGHRATVTDPLGNVTSMTYDAMGNLLTVTDPAGAVTTHSYDLSGNRVETVDRLGRKRTFAFDALNRMTHERWHDPADDAVMREMVFAYGNDQRLNAVTDGALVYGLNALASEELVTLSVTFPGLAKQDLRYAYEDRSRLLSVRLGVTTYHNIRRDSVGSPTQLLMFTPNSSVSARADLLRNSAKAPREIRRYSAFNAPIGSFVGSSDYTYNHRGRPATLVHRDATGLAHPESSLVYTHNPRGQVASVSTDGVVTTYAYNARGELSTGYAFDAGGNPVGASLSPGNRVESLRDFEYDWDAEGNLVQRRDTVSGELMDLTWDYRNRLTRVEIRPSAGATATSAVDYQYDYRDLQIGRTENGVTVWTLYGKDEMPFAEFTGSSATPTAIYYYDPDRMDRYLAEWREGEGIRWFLTDQIGSVRGVLDASGTVVGTANFDAFGNLTSSTGDESVIGFAGRTRDITTRFYNNRARHYDPSLGRFLSEDPIGFGGGETNLYRYAKNDPLNYTDPSGELSNLEYALLIIDVVDPLLSAYSIGRNINDCFNSLAKALENPHGGGSACGVGLLPMPGPWPAPAPGWQDGLDWLTK